MSGSRSKTAPAPSGRKTKIARISIDWGWTSRVHLADVEVANADWGMADHMFKAQEIDVDVRVWPLLHDDFVLPQLTLIRPEIYLERNAQEELNWSLQQSPVASGTAKRVQPEHRHQTPLIGRLEIKDGRGAMRTRNASSISTVRCRPRRARSALEPQAELSLKGRLEGQPLSVRFVGGSD
jgi:uncharacterized protein involved in outer membrane biogenesis